MLKKQYSAENLNEGYLNLEIFQENAYYALIFYEKWKILNWIRKIASA